MIYLHYDEKTGDFKGFYDDKFSLTIPEPSIVVDAKDHLKYLNALNNEQKKISIVNGKIVVGKQVVVLDWRGVRYERNLLLNSTDWTQLSDVPPELKAKYAKYRQELRDIPDTFTNSEDVVWPIKPS